MELVSSDRCFLSRPRRFGKSLTLSTLDAMFQGKAELFKGLAAEGWVMEQARRPAPVLRLDMSMMDVRDVACFEKNLVAELTDRSHRHGITLTRSDADEPGEAFKRMIAGLYDQNDPVHFVFQNSSDNIKFNGLMKTAQLTFIQPLFKMPPQVVQHPQVVFAVG